MTYILYNENNKEVARVTIEEENNISLLEQYSSSIGLLNTSYDVWSKYVFLKSAKIEITNPVDISMQGLISLLAAALPGWIGVSVTLITTIYNIIVYYNYEELWVKNYISTNNFCSILVRYKNEFYSDAGYKNLEDTVYIKYNWTGDPNNYSYPAACRVLKGQYPY